VGHGTEIPDPRPGWDLRNRVHAAGPSHGDRADTDHSPITVAEPVCRASDRFRPPRMLRPHGHLWRAPSKAGASGVLQVFPESQNPSRPEEGVPGSHVALKRAGRKDNPSAKVLEEAAAIAPFHSKARNSRKTRVSPAPNLRNQPCGAITSRSCRADLSPCR
jgi:hypothetical protein